MNGLIIDSMWALIPVLASITVTVTGAINGKFNITNGIWPQIVSWIVAAVLSVGSWFLGFVNVGEPTWLSVIALSLINGLVSNGVYDVPTIKNLINSWFSKKGLY